MLAAQSEAMLNDHGIKAEIIGGMDGGWLPQVSGTHGFKVMIDIDDWDAAVEIETSAETLENETGVPIG